MAEILCEVAEGVATITLNRPDVLNSFTRPMASAMLETLGHAAEDQAIRAVLLTGAGRGFCAGQDLAEAAPKDDVMPDLGDFVRDSYNPIVRAIRTLEKPVVCAVNGVAAGAGANLALCCDLVIARRSASFIQAFAKIGLVPDSGGTWFLPRLVGPARARGLALTGEPLSAEKAEAWGLIWKMHEDLELMAEAHRLCVHFTEAPTVALALIKRLLDESWANDLDAQLDLERETQREASLTPDYAEGMRAFFAKRPPAFSGRKGS
jgi:2-(1,2-epoxy-1,2-dihydrophenyl)acetyl-CoA isomerase